MKIFSKKPYKLWKQNATHFCIVAVSIILITVALPKGNEKMFGDIDEGTPWMHEPVTAEFEFSPKRPDDVVKAEKDSIRRAFIPYYFLAADKGAEQTAMFEQYCHNNNTGLSQQSIATIKEILGNLYTEGIIQQDPKMSYDGKNYDPKEVCDTCIKVVMGNSSYTKSVSELHTPQQAYESLKNDPRLSSQKQLFGKLAIASFIQPNLLPDDEKNEEDLSANIRAVPEYAGRVQKDQKIIDRGDIVDAKTRQILISYDLELSSRNVSGDQLKWVISGQIILVGILALMLTIYLHLFREDYYDKTRNILMLYVLLTIFPVIASLLSRYNLASEYVIPFAIVPIFVRVFHDSRTAFMAHTVTVLISAAAVRFQYDFIIIQLIAGMAAIYSLRELSLRSQVFRTAFVVACASALTYISIQLINGVQPDYDMLKPCLYFVGNGVLLLFAYPLMLVIEKIFGFTSDVTLIELSDTGKGLLRHLSEVAPGTFQHSITVSNLVAEIASKIDANVLLVRTGALYHDIGKITAPAFFTENQAGYNPLDEKPYKEGAAIVINHVTEGIRKANEAGLPSFILNFIKTHHGAGMARFFYVSYKNEHPGEHINKQDFSYPGPNPFTREQAILMMADAVEAASHSLNTYTEQSITDMVNRIIDNQIREGYFQDTPITFHDINIAKHTLTERLKSIYHTRISYPELKKSTLAHNEDDEIMEELD